jgi:hypothetical protein
MAGTAEDSRKVQEAIEAGVFEPLNAAHIAATARNEWVEEGRRDTSPIGLLVAKAHKRTTLPPEHFLEKYSRKHFAKPFESLSEEEAKRVSLMFSSFSQHFLRRNFQQKRNNIGQ